MQNQNTNIPDYFSAGPQIPVNQPNPPRRLKKRLPPWAITMISIAGVAAVIVAGSVVATVQAQIESDLRKYSNHTGNKGWTVQEARAAWLSIDGVERVEIRSHEWKSNPYAGTLGGSSVDSGSQGILEVAVNDMYLISNGQALIDNGIKTIWAINDLKISNFDPVILFVKGDVPVGYDWKLTGHSYDNSLQEKYAVKGTGPATTRGIETSLATPIIAGAKELYFDVSRFDLGDRIGNPPILNSTTFLERKQN